MVDDSPITSAVLGSGGMKYSPFMTIGEGGMAQVHLAKASGPSGFEKLVVLKTIRRNALSNPHVRKLFIDEARLCAQLNHPNLVQVHDVDLETDSPCLVMEHLDGKTLHEIQLNNVLARNMLLAVISEILAGLHYAHELRSFDGRLMNIVHRDMSPHNVFVTYDGTAKVLDFGIAKMAGATSDTATEDVRGKLSYIAPEQLLGGGVDRRADIFAVGVMLWECAVGKRMWDGVPEPAIMHRLANGDIPEVPIQAELTQPLIDLIRKATAPNPEDRYHTAQELRAALDAYLAASGRRPPMREIGQTLANTFAVERMQKSEGIRRALSGLTGTPEPPPAPTTTRSSTLDAAALETDEEPSGRGAYVLAAAILLTILAVGWVLSAPLRGRLLEAESGQGISQEPEHTPEADASVKTDNTEATGSPVPHVDEEVPQEHSDTQLDEPDAQLKNSDAQLENSEIVPDENIVEPPSARNASTKPGAKPTASPQASSRPPQAVKAKAPATTSAGKPASPTAPTAAPNCDTPFFYQNGIKAYRPECL